MLIQFNFRNFWSFREEVSLDMTATSITEHPNHVVIIGEENLLPVSIIYGANGSGKSEMLTQVAFFAGNVGSRGSDYKISIQYFKDGEPDGKIVSTVEGKIYFDGFYTVDLEDPVKLNKGDYFFVSVELDNAKIGTEQDYDIYGFEVTSDSQKGQSYMHVGNDFLDFHDFTRNCGYGDRFDNLMINAITVEK